MHPELFSMAFNRRVARYKLPRIRLHDLRHTWATLALSAGVDDYANEQDVVDCAKVYARACVRLMAAQ